jgi:hypothetical protein
MGSLDQISSLIALSMGAAWASGINLYAAILMLGLLGSTGHLILPADLQILANPLVIGAAGIMYLIEFVADKIPGIDNSWDALQTFIRVPAGAALAAGAVGALDPAVVLAAAIVGGGLAAGAHAAKAGTRVMLNTSPEPFSNWAASLSEDALVIAGLWAALQHPWLFLILLAVFLLVLIWLLPKIWRGIKGLWSLLTSLFKGREPLQPPPASTFADRK